MLRQDFHYKLPMVSSETPCETNVHTVMFECFYSDIPVHIDVLTVTFTIDENSWFILNDVVEKGLSLLTQKPLFGLVS